MGNDESQRLMERLERHPELCQRVKELLEIVENAEGDVLTADEAEERVVDGMRQIGHEAPQAWATRKQAQVARSYETRVGVVRRGKKTPLADARRADRSVQATVQSRV